MESKKGGQASKPQEKQTSLTAFYKKLAKDDVKPREGGVNTKESDVKDTDKETVCPKKEFDIGDGTAWNNNTEKRRKLEGGFEDKESPTSEPTEVSGREGAAINDTGQSVKYKLVHKTGDLFMSAETESLAHCVSRDLAMGKGIATLFKKTFGRVQELKNQGKEIGEVAVLRSGQRYIYYLITKEKYWHKPTYQTLEDSLHSMRRHMLDNGVKNLSMPKIGCGLDMLKWPKVEDMLQEIFSVLDVTISIYTLGS